MLTNEKSSPLDTNTIHDHCLKVAGAALFGFLLSKYEPVKCLRLTASLMIGALPIVVIYPGSPWRALS